MIGVFIVGGAVLVGLTLCWFAAWRKEREYGPWQEPDLSAGEPEEIGRDEE